MPKNKLKILLTGGHAHATAYALIKEIIRLNSDTKLFWIGPKSLMEGKSVKNIEDTVFKDFGIKVININAGRIQVKLTRFTLLSLIRIPFGFIQALIEVVRVKPDITVSFGGFVGLPVVFASWVCGIPVIIHEQTTAAGRGNIYASRFARKIVISRESSREYFPKEKTILLGNPIDRSKLEIKRRNKVNKKPVLFVTGGHTGSVALNNAILSVLPRLLSDFYVIHQTGQIGYKDCLEFKKKLKSDLSVNYKVLANIDPRDWPNMLQNADIIISRAGANAVSELVALKIPCILIPIPHTYLDEQIKNADFAVEFGIARKIDQKDLYAQNLIKEVNYLKDNWDKITNSVKHKKSLDLDAAKNFAKLIFDVAGKNK